jgi:hypothetical protein
MLAGLAVIAVMLVLVISAQMQSPGLPFLGSVLVLALVVVGVPVGVVIHEAGHLLACLALRVEVRGVQLGNGKSPRLRFTVRGVEVSLGLPYSGQVQYTDAMSAGRAAIITAAGSLANLIAAVAMFAVGPRGILAVTAALFTAGHVGTLGVLSLALLMTVTGVISLLPFRERNGRPTDGARLLGLFGGPFAAALRPRDAKGRLPLAGAPAALHTEYQELVRREARQLSPEQTARWLKAYWDREPLALHAVGLIGRSLRLQGRISELLALHADLPPPAGPRAGQLTVAAHSLDRQVLTVPGLPAKAVNLAVARVEYVLRTAEFKPAGQPWSREVALHTLALGRLRQGRFAEAEELCRPVLALPRPGPGTRATALATVALARRTAGLPYETELAEARFLAPDADLVAEAMEPASAKVPGPGPAGARQAQGV